MLEGCRLSCGICKPQGWDEYGSAVEVKPPPPVEELKAAILARSKAEAQAGVAEKQE
jgi:hypothetical protein